MLYSYSYFASFVLQGENEIGNEKRDEKVISSLQEISLLLVWLLLVLQLLFSFLRLFLHQ